MPPHAQSSTALHLLVVDDDAGAHEWMRRVFEREGYRVTVVSTVADAVDVASADPPALAVLDLLLPDGSGIDLLATLRRAAPDLVAIMLTGHGSVAGAVEAMAAGAYNYLMKPADVDALVALMAAGAARVQLARDTDRLVRLLEADGGSTQPLIWASVRMQQVRTLLDAVAPTHASVLITGENGVGKELVAYALHAGSPRARGPFVTVNCAAIPASLMEAELFGHRRGAFTGATADRVGLLAQARGGTLLLDEIGSMPLALQSKLLRVLQERVVRPVGALRPEPVDFRLLSATNVDLPSAVRDGQFREDLFYRLNTVTVAVPPLRERPEDISLLARVFIERFRRRHRREVSALDEGAHAALMAYPWPGNVRELLNAMERAVLTASGPQVTVSDLPDAVSGRQTARRAMGSAGPVPLLTLDELTRQTLVRALDRHGGNKTAAARALGLHRPTFYGKLRRYGLLDGE